ncbi:glycosyltransferase [Ectobacillus antri]
MEKVSIIIPFHNCPYIATAIESALIQTYPYVEVIVVNDGASSHAEKITPYLPYIRYFAKSNGGTASALNFGIQQASGSYFAWLSSDDIFIKDKIDTQLTFMKDHHAHLSYTNYDLIDGNGHVFQKDAALYFTHKLDFLKHLQHANNINGCTIMMKNEVFQTLGLFNENLKYTQDYDFWLRAVQHYELHYLNESLTQYRVHEAMGSNRFKDGITAEIAHVTGVYKQVLTELIRRERESI